MSLLVWYPLNGNLENKGNYIHNYSKIGNLPSVSTDGKVFPKSMSFDGNGRICIPFQPLLSRLNPKNQMSVCFWVKEVNALAWTSLFGWGDTKNRVEVSANQGSTYIFFGGDNAIIASNTTLWTDQTHNTWNHFAMCIDGTNVYFYLNGILRQTCPQKHTLYQSFQGDFNITIGGCSDNFNGKYNDYRIYNHCLSSKEVSELAKGLAVHYTFNNKFEIANELNLYSDSFAEGNSDSTSHFNKSKLANENGYNYKFSYTGTGSDSWAAIALPNLSYTNFKQNKTYYWSCKIRVNSRSSNLTLGMRHAFYSNDYKNTSGNVSVVYSSCELGVWKEYVISAKLDTSKIFQNGNNFTFDSSGYCSGISPKLEFYTISLKTSGSVFSIDLDLKDCQIIEADEYPGFIDNNLKGPLTDCSGYNNLYLTKIGSSSWTNSSKKYRYCANFNENGYFKNDSFGLFTDKFTIMFWLYPKANTNQHFLFGTFDNWTGNGIGMYRNGSATSYNVLLRSMSQSSYLSIPCPITNNEWIHIAIIYTGSKYRIFKNGFEYVTRDYSGTIYHPVMYIGNSAYVVDSISAPPSENENCYLSDFRFYTTEWTYDDLQEFLKKSGSIDNNGNMFAYEFVEN